VPEVNATVIPINWRSAGACVATGPDLFFGLDGEPGNLRDEREAKAKKICAACPVRLRCALDAIAGEIAWGVYGGLGETERAELIRESRREKAS
jgi:WhiB family transcriptional regulator, redox-sensing transcriptional regulator